ncbi:GntR family transcriptional regulator [Nocardioides allogilvus]|uniref:GntR family transcriptional regulator n=1 Tax=Nocardioides allogilvus TaxID=2072017 RepID=UPI0018E52A9E|nr:GntR family transcriptional regulator [Nocardioides allogilvus]
MTKPARREPAFRRLQNELRTQLLDRVFDAETALPTEAQLATQHGVSRQTVRRAFQDLVAEGLVTRVPGRGTFATPATGRYLRQFGSVDDLMSLSSDSEMRVLKPLGPVIDPIAASRLRMTHDRVHRVSFVRLHQGDPFSHTVVWLPPEIADLVADRPEVNTEGSTSAITVIGVLDAVLKHPIQDAEQSITVETAESVVAHELQVEPGTPLLRVDRMYFDSLGSPVELAVSHFHPDRYSYRVRLRRNLP